MKNWVEKYRPNKLSDFVFQQSDKEKFEGMIAKNTLPNLLFYGMRGTGKTTLAGVLLKELGVHKSDILRINCSDEKIDAIRDKVKPFATSMPEGDFRVVRLEEVDYLSHDAQALLRSFIEEVNGDCKFIATCNYVNKLLPELRSRFSSFNFQTPDVDATIERVFSVLNFENIKFDEAEVLDVVDRFYPDIRAILNEIESCSYSGAFIPNVEVDPNSGWKDTISVAVRERRMFDNRNVLQSLTANDMNDFFDHLVKTISGDTTINNQVLRKLYPIIAEYQYRLAFVGNFDISLIAMFCEMDAAFK